MRRELKEFLRLPLQLRIRSPFRICVSEEEEGKQYCVWKTLVQSKLQKYAMSQDPICILSASVTVFQNHQKMSPLNFYAQIVFFESV